LADFDCDGRLDLLSGSNCCDPYGLHLFRRRSDGSFEPRRHLEVDVPRGDYEIPTQSRVCVTDWDGDGQPDLLFTTTKASCLYVGTQWPDGNEPMPVRRVELPGPPRQMTGNYAVADWDGDGLADLLLGQWHEREFGRISWFRNVGRPGQPRYEEGRTLVPGTERPPYNSGFCVIGDGDSQLDLLVARVENHPSPSMANGLDVYGRLWLYPHGVGDRPDDACSLAERRPVEVEGKPLIVDNYGAFPTLGDLDSDGRPDLLLGDTRGFLKVYRNVGRPGRLRLTAPVRFGEFCDDERIPTG
jgi:hypothetical protein